MLRFLKELKHCASLDGWAEFLKHGKAETEASSFNNNKLEEYVIAPTPELLICFLTRIGKQNKTTNKQKAVQYSD